MSILIKSATIVDSKSNLNFKKKDILIKNGFIVDIADIINTKSENKIILDNIHLSRGWMDTSVSFGEPGYEERETLSNGLLTAASSGFTSIILNPDCNPPLDNHSSVEFLKRKSLNTTTDIHPVANLTNNANSSDLASLYDMKLAGAVGFGDYKRSITDSSILKIALEYTKSFGGRVITFCQDEFLSKKGVLNESIFSTELGLKGIPDISESINIYRDIEILSYTGGKIHIPYITTSKGVDLIREAKKKNLDITASVSLAHITFSEKDIPDFNTNFKIIPPIRTESDCNSLKEGLIDGTIDYLTSMHEPFDIDHKKVVFDDASPGSIGMESMFGLMCNQFTLEKTIDILTRNKMIFEIDDHPIEVGSKANLTLFNPDKNYQFSDKHILSSSKNCAFLGSKLKGVVYGSINGDKFTLNKLWT
jgi:dihydroorotase|tara:strand:- start:1600 stop:2862 length:1263 start_codon:yes stop_codon:yes gene_type:complete